jgi:hypothetical protein
MRSSNFSFNRPRDDDGAYSSPQVAVLPPEEEEDDEDDEEEEYDSDAIPHIRRPCDDADSPAGTRLDDFGTGE